MRVWTLQCTWQLFLGGGGGDSETTTRPYLYTHAYHIPTPTYPSLHSGTHTHTHTSSIICHTRVHSKFLHTPTCAHILCLKEQMKQYVLFTSCINCKHLGRMQIEDRKESGRGDWRVGKQSRYSIHIYTQINTNLYIYIYSNIHTYIYLCMLSV